MVVLKAVGRVLEIIIVVGEAKETTFLVFVAISYDLGVRIVQPKESTTMLTKGVVCNLMMEIGRASCRERVCLAV